MAYFPVAKETWPWPDDVNLVTVSRVQTIPRALVSSNDVPVLLLNLFNIIVGGDLNCPFAKDGKEEGRDLLPKRSAVAEIKVLLSSLDLEEKKTISKR